MQVLMDPGEYVLDVVADMPPSFKYGGMSAPSPFRRSLKRHSRPRGANGTCCRAHELDPGRAKPQEMPAFPRQLQARIGR